MVYRIGVCLVTCLWVSGCGTATQLDRSSAAVQVATVLPPPDTPVISVDVAPYHVMPGDELAISVFGSPELDRAGIVDTAGNFAFPLAGTLHVTGKTPQDISSDVEEQLRAGYFKHPHVSVNVKQSKDQRTVTVDGEVTLPGIYPVNGRITLQQVIATARGATDIANIRNVVVFRTVNNQKMAAMFDLKDIRSGRSLDPDIYGNDIVVVGQNAIQKALKTYSALLLPVLGTFNSIR